MADIKEMVICPWCKEEMLPYPHQGYYWFQCKCGARTPTLWHATEEQTRKRALSYTADVVPKSEVVNILDGLMKEAREIADRYEKSANETSDYDYARIEYRGCQMGALLVLFKIAEIKKKYLSQECPTCGHFVGCEQACGGSPCEEHTEVSENAKRHS